MWHSHAGSRALVCDHRAHDCQGHERWFLLHPVWRGEAAMQRALLWEELLSNTDCDLHIGSEGVLAGNGAQSYSGGTAGLMHPRRCPQRPSVSLNWPTPGLCPGPPTPRPEVEAMARLASLPGPAAL